MASGQSWLRYLGALAILALLILALINGRSFSSAPSLLLVSPATSQLVADGVATVGLEIRAGNGRPLEPADVQVQIVEGARRARVVEVTRNGGAVRVLLRAGVLSGQGVVEVRARGFAPVRARLETVLDPSDEMHDGTPDFLRLSSEVDRETFRRWFTFLAEAQYFRPTSQVPREINDCAALIRLAYREALREHDGAWASELKLESLPLASSVQKYRYPFTPLGAALFRVRPGKFHAEDPSNGAFAQFADAQTLARLNTHLVSRDVRRARPGDLLFFRQLEQSLPFHAMIFLGPSQFERVSGGWVIYHSGPISGGKGEIRRVRLEELLRHPSPRWRPEPGNANFLGVFRWNILRGPE